MREMYAGWFLNAGSANRAGGYMVECRSDPIAMDRTRRAVMSAVLLMPFAAACARRQAPPVVELHIATDGDELAFKPDRLRCRTGSDVHLFFHHAGEILSDPHDWVLLKPGTQKAFLADADKEPDETVVVPAKDVFMVLAATPLCAKGQSVMVKFVAPAPGEYPFVCSVPGHGETMHGTLVVTA
jgi:azurin